MSTVCFVLSFTGSFVLGFLACLVISVILALRSEGKKKDRSSKVSYSMYYDKKPIKEKYDDVLFETRESAEEILNQMLVVVNNFGFVSISDFLEMAGLMGEYTDTKFGWKDLCGVHVIPAGNGYRIHLPKPTKLEQ